MVGRAVILVLLGGLWLSVSAGCEGWDVGTHWIGDGNREPDPGDGRALSDTGAGQDAAKRMGKTLSK